MAKLKLVEDIIEDIEKKADGYAVLNTLSNIAVHIVGFYLAIEISVYIWRSLTGH